MKRIKPQDYDKKLSILLSCGFSAITARSLMRNPRLYNRIDENIKDNIDLFDDYGFNMANTAKIIRSFPNAVNCPTIKSKEVLDHLLVFGFSHKQIHTIIPKAAYILGCSPERNNGIFDTLLGFGISKDQVIEMVEKAPRILTYSSVKFNSFIHWFEDIGLNNHEIIRLLVSNPKALTYSIDKMAAVIDTLEVSGMSKEKIHEAIKISPVFLDNSIEKITNVINAITAFLDKNKYDKNDWIAIIKSNPAVLSSDIKRTISLLDLYNQHSLVSSIIKKSKYLIQSYDLSYARINFLIKTNQSVGESVFLPGNLFEKRYKISRENLLKNYDPKPTKLEDPNKKAKSNDPGLLKVTAKVKMAKDVEKSKL